jgi:hypothetical protein
LVPTRGLERWKLGLSIVGYAGAAAAFVVGYRQYRRADYWKRSEFLAKEMKDFFADPEVGAALTMIEWGVRRVKLNMSSSDPYVRVDRKLQCAALRPHTMLNASGDSDQVGSGAAVLAGNNAFTPAEAAIGDAYDHFLDGLNRFGTYLAGDLLTVTDLGPYLNYWVESIADTQCNAEDSLWSLSLLAYINFYSLYRCAAAVHRPRLRHRRGWAPRRHISASHRQPRLGTGGVPAGHGGAEGPPLPGSDLRLKYLIHRSFMAHIVTNILYNTDIINIRSALVPQALPGIGAISVEIGHSPRVIFFQDVSEIPAHAERPLLVALGPAWSRRGVARRSSLDRLIEVVGALMRHEKTRGVIEIHEASELAHAFEEMVATSLAKMTVDVMVYSPHDAARRGKLWSDEELSRTWEALQEFLATTAGEERTQVRAVNPALDAARARRSQLLSRESWLTAAQVHEQQGGIASAAGANNTASRLRRRGELLGAWDGREYRHPAFQFDRRTGRVMPEVKELLALLPKDRSGWRQVFWLFQPHTALEDKRPADVFPRDPQAVMGAAQSTFELGHSNW